MCSTRIAHTLFTIFCRKIEFLQEKLNSPTPTQDPRMIVDFFFDNHRMDCDRKKAGLPGSKLLKTNHMLTAEDVPTIGGQWGRSWPQSLKRKLHKIWVKAVLWCERCDQVNCVFLTTMKTQLLEQLLPRHSFQKRCSLHSFFNIGKILNYPFLYRH